MSEPFPGYRFAGIDEAERLGYGVEENAARLHRLAYVERQCLDVAAGHLLSTPEWEIKFLLGRHLYEDAEHHHLLRTRIGELRRSEKSIDRSPDPALSALMDEAIRTNSTAELLAGLYRVIKPMLVTAYQDHLRHINPLVDYPTGRALQSVLREEEEHVALGEQYLSTLLQGKEQEAEAAAWEQHLRAFVAAAGGLSGDGPRLPAVELPAARADGNPWQMPRQSARDARFTVTVPKNPAIAVPERGEPTREGLEQMMWVRFHEMSPAEAVASILYLIKDRPWAFYRDLARHCWDEVRHCAFGQAALQSEDIDITANPNWTGWAEMALTAMDPLEAYTHLTIAIEQAAMKYPPGKRQEYEFARDAARHALMALYQDYDWADEVEHAHFGQQWIIKDRYHGDHRAAMAAGKATVQRRLGFFARYATDGTVPDPISGRATQDSGTSGE